MVHEISVLMYCNKKLESRKKRFLQAGLKFYWEKYTAFSKSERAERQNKLIAYYDIMIN